MVHVERRPHLWRETSHRKSVDVFPKVWSSDLSSQHSLEEELGGAFAVVTGNDLWGFEPVVEQ